MSVQLRGLNPVVRIYAQWCLDVANHYKVPVTVTSGKRSSQQQARLRAAWEKGQSKWPANKPGDSSHEYGLAWDSTVPERFQEWWNMVRRSAGFSVPPNDHIHAEVPNWRQYKT